jgi:Glycosyl transferase family 2
VSARGLVSCLCITEGRPSFMPWLLWGYDRQVWRERELIIVDSSATPFRSDRPDVRVIAAPPGTNVPTKRNLALAAATGDLVAWFDDDDWQHPQRLSLIAQALADDAKAVLAGGTRSFFVDLHGDSCRGYEGHGTIIFNGAGFQRAAAQAVRFNEAQRRASDTTWMQALAARGGGHRVVAPQVLTAWLSHEQNISNDRRRWRFPLPLAALRSEVGAAMWADTDERLEALRRELPEADPLPIVLATAQGRAAVPAPRPRQQAMRLRQILGHASRRRRPGLVVRTNLEGRPGASSGSSRSTVNGGRVDVGPSAGLAVLACLLDEDTARAALLVPHFVRQTRRTPNTTIVLLPETAAAECRLDLDVPAAVADCVVRAVSPHVGPDPLFTRQSLLLALDRAEGAAWVFLVACGRTLLGAGRSDWVEPALSRLRADPSLVMVGLPSGPPRGAIGTACGLPSGIRDGVWDGRLHSWRSNRVAGSAFLADRQRLRDVVGASNSSPTEAEPLETILDRALAKSTRSFGTLAMKEAWTAEIPAGVSRAQLARKLAETERQVWPAPIATSGPIDWAPAPIGMSAKRDGVYE